MPTKYKIARVSLPASPAAMSVLYDTEADAREHVRTEFGAGYEAILETVGLPVDPFPPFTILRDKETQFLDRVFVVEEYDAARKWYRLMLTTTSDNIPMSSWWNESEVARQLDVVVR